MIGAQWFLIIVSRDQRGCECLLSAGTGFPNQLDRVTYCHQEGERNVPGGGLGGHSDQVRLRPGRGLPAGAL